MQRRLLVFLILFASFSLVYSSAAYYALSKRPSQPFIAMGIFSQSESLSNYFSGAGVNVTLNQVLRWHFEVTNQMGLIQYGGIVYRLGNNTTVNPNSTTPATGTPQIGNTSRFIPNGQIASINFTWIIRSRVQSHGLVFLNMTINGQPVSPPVGALNGQKFRLFFELWTYDLTSNSFQYGYKGQNSRVGTWLQIWFNVP